MEMKEYVKMYQEQGDKASDFLDKAILTICSSFLWWITIFDIFSKVEHQCSFLIWIIFLFFSFAWVIISYLIAINNTHLGISYFYKDTSRDKKSRIPKYMKRNNFVINILRYFYTLSLLLALIFIFLWYF